MLTLKINETIITAATVEEIYFIYFHTHSWADKDGMKIEFQGKILETGVTYTKSWFEANK